MKLLSHAMDYWSNGSQKAIFLNHEVCIYLYALLLNNNNNNIYYEI
jgi:pantothenate kinase